MYFTQHPYLDKVMFHANDERYTSYRIPGIISCNKNTLIACVEARENARSDWGKIDIIILVSNDVGNTWHETIVITSKDGQRNTYSNPTLSYDSNTVFLIYHKDYKQALLITSEDHGLTWSNEIDITSTYHKFDYSWNVCATGPGHGIFTSDEKLIFPIWLANGAVQEDGTRKHWPSVAGYIISQDHGKSWNPGILAKGLIDGNETSICELTNKDLLFNFRTRNEARKRTIGFLRNGKTEYQDIHVSEELDDPMCYGSTIRIGNNIILINCHDTTQRISLSLFVSYDQGKTWKRDVLIDKIGGYSDIAWSGESLFVLYERQLPENKQVQEIRLKAYKLQSS